MFQESPKKELQHKETQAPSPDAYQLYLKDIRGPALLSKDEEQHYGRLSQQGDQKAKHRMIESNLRLVLKIAKKYTHSGLPLSDLIAEGNLGLMHAVNKFDPERGFRFSTYSAYWIQQNIEKAILNQKPTVRLPLYLAKKLRQCLKMKQHLSHAQNPEPNAEAIAEAMGKTPAEIEKMLQLHETRLSMDGPLSEEIPKPLLDSLKIEKQAEPFFQVNQLKTEQHINSCLAILNPRQQAILARRFGLNGFDSMTLDETGLDIGLTPERVRQLQSEALHLLRRCFEKQGDNLSSFMT